MAAAPAATTTATTTSTISLVCYLCNSSFFPNPRLREQQSKEDIDKPKMQSLEDILKELDAEEAGDAVDVESDEELELERRMEEILAGEIVSCAYFNGGPLKLAVIPAITLKEMILSRDNMRNR